MREIASVCVFCGSSHGSNPAFAEAGRAVGEVLAQASVTVVYGGGTRGIMGVVAHSAMEAGGTVIGVIPGAFQPKEGEASFITHLEVVQSMHERKARMEKISDAFVALPGGFGTFEELCEITTWQQLGLHRKPIALFNVDGYWNDLLAMMDRAVLEGFVSQANRAGVIEVTQAENLLHALQTAELPPEPPWLWPENA